jgi:peptide/nickel transport system substrate-binding protein
VFLAAVMESAKMLRLLIRLAPVLACLTQAVPADAQHSPKRGGVLSFAVTAEPPNYDCHASQTFTTTHTIIPFYSYLLKIDTSQGGKIIGDLAKEWTISPDGLTYTFTIHEGVKFHDGTPLTSADIKASFERIANPPEGVVSMRKSNLEAVDRIDAPDPKTVTFRLRQVNVSMLENLASPFNCIYSAAKLKHNAKYPETEIMGSGAYQFSEHVRGSSLSGKKFGGYFRQGLPYLDGFKAVFVKSNAVVPGMLGGQFDVEFRGRTPSERDQLMKSPEKWVLHEGPWTTNNIVIFNTTKKPFDDPRVRRALSLAIDRRQGGEALSRITFVKSLGGFLRPGYEFALPEAELLGMPGYGADIVSARAEARRLLQEAGVSNLSIKLHNRNLAEPYTPIGVFLIDQWRRIGVNVEHIQLETAPYFGNMVDGNFEVAYLPPPSDDVTATYLYYLTNTKSKLSYARHNDSRLDDLWERQTREIDPAKRKAIIHEMERLMLAENYYLSIAWWQRIIVLHRKIKGWHFSPSHFYGQDLAEVWLDE